MNNWTTKIEFSLPKSLKGAFALIEPWESPKSAEHENIQRIIKASGMLGLKCILISYDGYRVDELRQGINHRIDINDVDFVISLHFHTPKVIGIHSYGCLWSPPQHYFDWGYENTTQTLLTHDDFLHSGSIGATGHLQRLLFSSRRKALINNQMPFYLSIAGPVLTPNIENLRDPKLFYCGINWEKIDGSKGRYQDLFKMLETNTKLEIYGPEFFHGKQPWEGFKSYIGPIPMDGESTVYRVAQCGVSLVLSSEAHIDTGLMTNRLYESLAAGALLIVNENIFVRSHFGDSVLYIKNTPDQDLLYEQIMSHLRWTKANPEEALNKAIRAQNIFKEKFQLDKVIANIYSNHIARKNTVDLLVNAIDRISTIDVIVPFTITSIGILERCVKNITCQEYKNIKAIFILDERTFAENKVKISKIFEALPNAIIVPIKMHQDAYDWRDQPLRNKRIGEMFNKALEYCNSEFLNIMSPMEEWFPNHLSTLKRVLEDDEQLDASYSGVIKEFNLSQDKTGRRVEYIIQDDLAPFFFATQFKFSGSFLFKENIAKVFSDEIYTWLDGCEHTLLLLHAVNNGGVGASELATLIHSEQLEGFLPTTLTPVTEQSQFIRDVFRFDRSYLNNIATLNRPRKLIYAFDSGAPISTKTLRSPASGLTKLKLGETIRFGLKGSALSFQTYGWSKPEKNWTWMEGTRAAIGFELEDIEDDVWFSFSVSSIFKEGYQKLTVSVNGVMLGIYRFVDDETTSLSFLLPRELIRTNQETSVQFETSDAKPSDTEDNRLLSMKFEEFFLLPWSDMPVTSNIVTREFDNEAYLNNNPDVADAVQSNKFKSGYEHFLQYGMSEQRKPFWKNQEKKPKK